MSSQPPSYVIDLPYEPEQLAPFLSKETLDFHYEKHHKGYAHQLDALISAHPDYAGLSLTALIKKAHADRNDAIFNNAAQIWNHNFYWQSLCPKNQSCLPQSGPVYDALIASFKTNDHFFDSFVQSAVSQFGSGWVWLVRDQNNVISIQKTSNAGVPWLNGQFDPLYVCDVWEHAYYIDYRNRRKDYVVDAMNYINWDFVSANMEKPRCAS